jgi:hypothetical protein
MLNINNLKQRLVANLVSGDPALLLELSAMSALLSDFSDSISSVHIEFRLQKSTNIVFDLIIAFDRHHLGIVSQLIADKHHTHCYQNIQNYIRHRQENAFLVSATLVLWLEYDYCTGEQNYSQPSVCFTVNDDYLTDVMLDRSNNLAVITSGIEGILNDRIQADYQSQLVSLMTHLQGKGTVIHVSVMQSRQPVAVKLFVEIDRQQLDAFLDAAQWGGDRQQLQQMLSRMFDNSPAYQQLYVDINVTDFEQVNGSRLAFTFTSQHLKMDPGLPANRADVVKKLIAEDLCDRAFLTQIEQWPHISYIKIDNVDVRVNQWLDIKLVWENNQISEAKAYLAYSEHEVRGFEKLKLIYKDKYAPCQAS